MSDKDNKTYLDDAGMHVVPWKLEDGRVIHLLTPEELRALPRGALVVCIDGTTAVVGKDYIDDDTRMGRLAFGILSTPAAHD